MSRQVSKNVIESIGYQYNSNLPLINQINIFRKDDDLVDRILALYACVACSYGFSEVNAINWLKIENLWDSVLIPERQFLSTPNEITKSSMQWQVEALWSLTWLGSYHNDLDFKKPCPDSFIELFPDLKSNESTNSFRRLCRLRSIKEIHEKLDLYYCLHWSIRNTELTKNGKQSAQLEIENQVIVERRRSFEWLICEDDWYEISLDT